MRKLFMLLVAGLLIFGMVGSALADVDVTTTVTKTKTVTPTYTINVQKVVALQAKQLLAVDLSAEADVTKNDAIAGNLVLELPSEVTLLNPPAYGVMPPLASEVVNNIAQITDTAFQNAVGLISVNQAPGSANNQGNAVAVAYADVGNAGAAFLHAQAAVEMENGTTDTALSPGLASTIESILYAMLSLDIDIADNFGGSNVVLSAFSVHTDTITDNAFETASGVIGVNQSAGVVNNQNNAVSMAIGGTPSYSLAEADLGMVTANNVVIGIDLDNTDTISLAAFNSAIGVISLNQSSGTANNQANTIAVTAASLTGPF